VKAEKWEGAELALRMWGAAQDDLEAYRRGVIRDSWRVVGQMIAGLDAPDPLVLLDVGCGIGAACEILAGVSGREIDYWGADCNHEAISIAWSEFPKHNFMPCDILDMATNPIFDIVMSNGTLNHIHEWQDALRNMAALSNRWILLHRLWVYLDKTASSGAIKQAYNRNLWHMRINEGEMSDYMAELGFGLAERVSSDLKNAPTEGWTYLFEKVDK